VFFCGVERGGWGGAMEDAFERVKWFR